jgi:putative tryptophan/tyrosine transport system substrate-binding protein
LLTNLSRPGGNLTGVSINAGIEIDAKRVQLLKEAMPAASKIAHLLSGRWVNDTGLSLREAGQRLGITVIAKLLPEVTEPQLRRNFAEMTQEHFDGALVDEGGSFLALRALIVELAEKLRLPIIYPYRDYVDLGGMMAYAPDLAELAQRMANDVHQILNGAKPGDIPYFQPSKFQLIINLKTAKATVLIRRRPCSPAPTR